MINVKAEKPTFKGFVLVRDKHGKPQIDEYHTCPDEIKALLTPQEKEDSETCH